MGTLTVDGLLRLIGLVTDAVNLYKEGILSHEQMSTIISTINLNAKTAADAVEAQK
ncbi:MAG: hypothetical protein ACYDAO_09440 [Thermoplasmataceae archaeon]